MDDPRLIVPVLLFRPDDGIDRIPTSGVLPVLSPARPRGTCDLGIPRDAGSTCLAVAGGAA
ncbi:hypothetical protein [Methanofollis ethanolicus]|uniref:hypothetical protein n=1 Tax=Methanofollis ethanolicus TaxID=488124 RepID=UPI00083483C1|nr:hypothetical protein [Methanofollis ethanolicus]